MGEASAAVRGVGKAGRTSQAQAAASSKAWAGAAGLVSRGMKATAFAAAAAGYEALKLGINFDNTLLRIETTTGAAAGEMEAMRKHILNMQSAFSPQQLAESARYIEAIGIRGKRAFDVLDNASNGAALSGANVIETSRTLAGIMRVQIPGALGSAAQVMAKVNAAVGTGAISLDEFNHAMGQGVLPVAKEYGLTFDDIIGALDVFTDEHIKGSSSMAQLATAMHFLTGSSSRAEEGLHRIGLKGRDLTILLQKPNGLMLALSVLKRQLDTTFGRSPEGLAQQVETLDKILPGGRGRILRVLMNQIDVYSQKLKQNKNVTADYNNAVEKYHKSAAYKIREAWNQVQTRLIELYDNIKGPGVGSLVALLGAVNKLVGGLVTLTDHGKTLKGIIVPLAAAVLTYKVYMMGAAAAEALFMSEGLISFFIRAAAATDIWTASMVLLDAALLSNPLVLIGLGIAVLVGLLVMVAMHWDRVKAAAVSAWHWTENGASNVWHWITGHWPLLLAIITGPFGLAALFIISHFNGIVAFFRGLPGRIANAVVGLYDGIKVQVLDLIHWATRQYHRIPKPVRSILQFGFNSVTYPERFAAGLVHGRLVAPPVLGGRSANIPGAAAGADIISGGSLWVGERGPEIVSLPAGASVKPLAPNFGAGPSKQDLDLTSALGKMTRGGRRPIENRIFLDGKLFYRTMSQYAADGRARG
jgi:TP901 family phage tail tape measure protein